MFNKFFVIFSFFTFSFFGVGLISPNVIDHISAATFKCAYDGTNCNKATASFCPGVPDSNLVSFCIPKNSFTCDGDYECALVGGPTSTPVPGGPSSTPIPPSSTPAVCSSLGVAWSCQPATLIGTFNCNATNPAACDPNDPPTCTGTHPNIFDDYCGSGYWCCGPSLINTNPEVSLVPPFFCNIAGNSAGGLDTGLGCIPFWVGPFTAQAISWGVSTNLAIAIIIIAFAAISFMFSAGDPKKIQAAKELFIAALSGLFLIAITVLLLNYLGVKVLSLSSLGFNQTSQGRAVEFIRHELPTLTPDNPIAIPTTVVEIEPTLAPPLPTHVYVPRATPTPICTTVCQLVTECKRETSGCDGGRGSECGTDIDGNPKYYCTFNSCTTTCI